MAYTELKLSEVADSFDTTKRWWFMSCVGLKHFWAIETHPPYQFFFHVNKWSELKQPATIHDLVAAADENRSFGLTLFPRIEVDSHPEGDWFLRCQYGLRQTWEDENDPSSIITFTVNEFTRLGQYMRIEDLRAAADPGSIET